MGDINLKNLKVRIEIDGISRYVGDISGSSSADACFSYAEEYLADSGNRPISISLPLQDKPFDAKKTRTYFEGLLPEGFTRRCVEEWMHADNNDYLAVLSGLGKECLGAVMITDDDENINSPEYKKLTDTDVQRLAQEGATQSAELVTKSHLSLTGASGKVGLYYDENSKEWYQPIGSAPSTYIVKQSHVRMEKMVVNEQLCLAAARELGVEIPYSFIVPTKSRSKENILFASKRYDRKIKESCKKLNGLPVPLRLHQEDFAQALGIPAAEKYEKNNDHYFKRIFELVRNYSSDPIADQLKLWRICVFNYLIGNTDNHIKNLSLIYGEDLKGIRLAPAYDMISTAIYESSTEQMAMSINGKYDIFEITRDDFEKEALSIGIGTKPAMKIFDSMSADITSALEKAVKELKKAGFTQAQDVYERILSKRKKT